MLTLYDAARCPYCARVRIVLAEKGVETRLFFKPMSRQPGYLDPVWPSLNVTLTLPISRPSSGRGTTMIETSFAVLC